MTLNLEWTSITKMKSFWFGYAVWCLNLMMKFIDGFIQFEKKKSKISFVSSFCITHSHVLFFCMKIMTSTALNDGRAGCGTLPHNVYTLIRNDKQAGRQATSQAATDVCLRRYTECVYCVCVRLCLTAHNRYIINYNWEWPCTSGKCSSPWNWENCVQ